MLISSTNSNCCDNFLTRKIGRTTYKIKVAFAENESETMEDKILRMIKNEVLINSDVSAVNLQKLNCSA